MGSIVSTCNKKETIIINQDIYLSFDNNISEEEEHKINNIIQKIKGIYTKTYFEILKNYTKQISNNNKNDSDKEIIKINTIPQNKNNNDNEINKNNTEEINNKEVVNKKQNKNENDNKKLYDLQSNNGNLTLNSSAGLKSVNINESDSQINDNLKNQETPNPSQNNSYINKTSSVNESNRSKKTKNKLSQKKIQKKNFCENLTPIPEYPTPIGNYDKTKMPGDLIFNFNDIPLNDEIIKVENDIGEFIIEQKELLKYMEQYPYVPKNFSIKYPSGEKYSGYFSPDWEKEVFGIQINKDGSKYVGFFKNGMFEGRGRLILKKGDYFEGEFMQNKANGF